MSGCFGALYSHVGLAPPPPAPLLPSDRAAPTGPAASLPQTPLALFLMSPLLHPGVFGYPQQTPMTPEQRRQFLDQQRQFQDFQQLSTAQSRPLATVSSTLPVEALQFDSTSPSPLRPSPVCASVESSLLTSLAASVAPQTESMVIATEAATSSSPTTSTAPSLSLIVRTTSTSSDDDVDCFYAAPSMMTPTQSSPPQK